MDQAEIRAGNKDRRRIGAWERHLQSLLLAIATGVLFFLAKFVYDANATFVSLEARLAYVSNSVSKAASSIEELARQAETRSEHDRDMTVLSNGLADHEDRIRTIERQRPGRRP